MSATFTKAIRYSVEAECVTPFRTGGADGDVEGILRRRNGRAIIQGSSIAGALRAWLEKDSGVVAAKSLFGSQDSEGSLVVSDAVFSEDATSVVRPRLRINGSSGTAKDKSKFDVMHVQKGSECSFSVTWLGNKDNETDNDALVKKMLGAVHCGHIRLGAQKTNGFGRLKLEVKRRVFDMYKPEDRMAWIEGRDEGTKCPLPDVQDVRNVVFTLTGKADSILVKAGYVENRNENEDKGSYTPNMTEAGEPILPGSSVKGAIKSRAVSIANYLGVDDTVIHGIFGIEAKEPGEKSLPGRVIFDENILIGEKRIISRIRINKFTKGVMRGGLFAEETVCSDVSIKVTVPVDCPEGCILIFYALRDLGMGLYNLGSGGSIGRGFVNAKTLNISVPNAGELSLVFDDNRDYTINAVDGVISEWRKSLAVPEVKQ